MRHAVVVTCFEQEMCFSFDERETSACVFACVGVSMSAPELQCTSARSSDAVSYLCVYWLFSFFFSREKKAPFSGISSVPPSPIDVAAARSLPAFFPCVSLSTVFPALEFLSFVYTLVEGAWIIWGVCLTGSGNLGGSWPGRGLDGLAGHSRFVGCSGNSLLCPLGNALAFRTFLSPLLRLYDRALSTELRLETLQFLLACVITASVAEGQANEEKNDGKDGSLFLSEASPKATSGLEDHVRSVGRRTAADEELKKPSEVKNEEESVQEEKNTLRAQLLAHMDAVQVSEFVAYVLQTKPSVTAVGRDVSFFGQPSLTRHISGATAAACAGLPLQRLHHARTCEALSSTGNAQRVAV